MFQSVLEADLSECTCRIGGSFSTARSALGMAGAKAKRSLPIKPGRAMRPRSAETIAAGAVAGKMPTLPREDAPPFSNKRLEAFVGGVPVGTLAWLVGFKIE